MWLLFDRYGVAGYLEDTESKDLGPRITRDFSSKGMRSLGPDLALSHVLILTLITLLNAPLVYVNSSLDEGYSQESLVSGPAGQLPLMHCRW